MKKILSALMVAAMCFTMLTQPAFATEPEESELKTLVREQIDAYAASIDDNSSVNGLIQILTHFITKGGADLLMDENDAFAAMLMNTEVVKRAFTDAFTVFIESDETNITCNRYKYVNVTDWKEHVAGSSLAYYNNNKSYYLMHPAYRQYFIKQTYIPDSAFNSCDKAAVLTVGGASLAGTNLEFIGVDNNEAIYRVNISIHDDFDFNVSDASYDAMFKDADSTLAKLLTTVGKMVSWGIAKEFYWECNIPLEIRVPYDEPLVKFDWSDDYSSCTALLIKDGISYYEKCNVSISEMIAAKCNKYGTASYTATAVFDGENYETVKNVSLGLLPHTLEITSVAPTCTKNGLRTEICTACNYSTEIILEATGHNFGEWSANKTATCTETGEEQRTCLICNQSETRVVAALGHTYEHGFCTACGNKILGDVNGDNKTNSADVNLLHRFVLNYVDLNDKQYILSDVNKDGKLNSADVNLLYRFIMGYVNSL